VPNRSREKGDRFERACVQQLVEMGVSAERVPLSGAAGGSFTDDIIVAGHQIECKTRARAWSDLFGWLNPRHHAKPPHALFIKADRTDTLVVMTLETFAETLKGCW
jgi:hypothetical protein